MVPMHSRPPLGLACLPARLLAFLRVCTSACVLTCWPACLSSCLPVSLFACRGVMTHCLDGARGKRPCRLRQQPRQQSGGNRCWCGGETGLLTILRRKLCSPTLEPAELVAQHTQLRSTAWMPSTRSGFDTVRTYFVDTYVESRTLGKTTAFGSLAVAVVVLRFVFWWSLASILKAWCALF